MAGATQRLFLALWPPAPVRQALLDCQAAWTWPEGAARVPAQRLHLTLHFIGAVPVARVPPVVERMAVPFEPFELELASGRSRVWPGGIAVLELDAPSALLRLHAALADALRAEGLAVEDRRYRPHVTFARRATGARIPSMAPPIRWAVRDGYALVRSIPGRGYETLRAYA